MLFFKCLESYLTCPLKEISALQNWNWKPCFSCVLWNIPLAFWRKRCWSWHFLNTWSCLQLPQLQLNLFGNLQVTFESIVCKCNSRCGTFFVFFFIRWTTVFRKNAVNCFFFFNNMYGPPTSILINEKFKEWVAKYKKLKPTELSLQEKGT